MPQYVLSRLGDQNQIPQFHLDKLPVLRADDIKPVILGADDAEFPWAFKDGSGRPWDNEVILSREWRTLEVVTGFKI